MGTPGPAAPAGPADSEGVDAFLAALARWTADTRVEEAAGARVRERWLRQQAAEDARFAGVLMDLGEAGAGVAVVTTAGHTLHGRIAAVARDFCVLRHGGGLATLLTFSAMATVRPEPGHRAGDADSARIPPLSMGFVEVLARLAPERHRVRVVMDGGGEAVAGELRTVGADVATLRLDGDPPSTVYLQLGAVREVTLLG